MLKARARQAGEPPDGPSYVKSLAGRLMLEPRVVAIACCDPVHGLLTEIFVKPTIADIVRWCRHASEDWHHMVADDDRRWREDRDHGIDRSQRPSIEELRAKYGETWGIRRLPAGGLGVRDDHDESEEAAKERRRAQAQEALAVSNRMIEREYARRGAEPVRAGGGMLVSAELCGLLGRPVGERSGEDMR